VVAVAEFVAELQEAHSLSDLPLGATAVVTSVDAEQAGVGVARRLAEIGFLSGEIVRILARVPGGDPIAVRIGSSTFALRCYEAACIRVQRQQTSI
jgi:ferrous iron transport protein A